MLARALVHMRSRTSGNGGNRNSSGGKHTRTNTRKTNGIYGHNGRVYTSSFIVQKKNRNVVEASSV